MTSIKNSKIIFLLVALFIFSLFAIVEIPSVFACDCVMPGTPDEELKEATVVFSGIVTDIDRNLTGYGYKVRFDVEKTWKGISEKTVVVSTGMGGADCGYGFKEGERYFVYAYGDTSSLGANICSRTRLLSAAGDDLSALGEGQILLSQPNNPSGGQLSFSNNLIFITILAAIILALIIYKVISSRKKVS